jgi:hypothetical protein
VASATTAASDATSLMKCPASANPDRAAVWAAATEVPSDTTVRSAIESELLECRELPTQFRPQTAIDDFTGREDWRAIVTIAADQVVVEGAFIEAD